MRARLGTARQLLVAIALSWSCAAAPPCETAPRDPRAAPLVWQVHGKGGATVWLFGTIHDLGSADVPAAAWQALGGAPAFVSELGDREPDRQRLSELARLPWGQVLDRLLPPDDWWELVTAMAGSMSEDELRHARPWFALVRLRSQTLHSPPSMDTELVAAAQRHGLAIAALESWDDQITALDASTGAAELSNAIRARHAAACDLAALVSAYRTNNVAALTQMLIGAHADTLLVERNRRWLPRLERYLDGDGGGAFVAVGLGHLLGASGVPAMLAQAGYTVEGPAVAADH